MYCFIPDAFTSNPVEQCTICLIYNPSVEVKKMEYGSCSCHDEIKGKLPILLDKEINFHKRIAELVVHVAFRTFRKAHLR